MKKPISFVSKQIILFISILLVLGIFVISANQVIINSLKKETIDNMNAQDMSFFNNLESQLTLILQMQYGFFSNEDLILGEGLWPVKDPFEGYVRFNNVSNDLNRIKNSSPLFTNAVVNVLSLNLSIDNNTVRTISDKAKEEIEIMKNGNQPIKNINGRWKLVSIWPRLYDTEHDSIKFIFEVELSKDQIIKMLNQLNDSVDSGSILLLNKENSISAYKGDLVKKEDIENYLIMNIDNITDDIVNLNGNKYLCSKIESSYYNLVMLRYRSHHNLFNMLETSTAFIIIFLCMAIIMVVIFSYYTSKFIRKPINDIIMGFQQLEKGQLELHLDYKYNDEFSIMFKSFNTMSYRLNAMVNNIYLQTIDIQRAKLKQLQFQIDPHFLYNSFFILQGRIRMRNLEGAEDLAVLLGEYFRFVTKNNADFISFKEEWYHTIIYFNIQFSRFKNKVIPEISEPDEEFNNLSVPRLIFQPIVENVFKHAFENMEHDSFIKIWFQKQEGFFYVIIENGDNGTSITDEKISEINRLFGTDTKESEISGLVNIDRRLRLYYDASCGLQLKRSSLGGLKVIITLKSKKGR